ncbi:hypothetical protein [Niallia circulans]|uniref:hypothetical protein n=1 Tax=Niallia circulans TaxID=1397 RepID=UPI0026EF38A8|nr:hypothetical protein [Niallia circulans]
MSTINKSKLLKELGLIGEADVNAIRQAVVTNKFSKSIGKRTLILLGPYPFMIIGTILEVVSDFVRIKVEVTNISELDGEIFRLHIDQVEVFFIEDGKYKIPNLNVGSQ